MAEDYGIVLAPELWPPSYPTSDVHAMITLMRLIDSKNFRHTLDNYQLPADWAVTAFRLLAPFATHVHISTRGVNDGPNDQRFRFNSFVGTLKSTSYDGYLMIEARPLSTPIPARIRQLRKTKNMLQRLWA
jgi:sugar phosphate isomerase/epimerase